MNVVLKNGDLGDYISGKKGNSFRPMSVASDYNPSDGL